MIGGSGFWRGRGKLRLIGSLAIVSALASMVGAAPGLGQAVDCRRLQTTIRTMNPDAGGGRAGQYAKAAQRQRYEIDRTRGYAASIGCNGQSGLFGDDPPQCQEIANRIERMQGNLAQIDAQMQSAPDDGPQRSDLIARYNTYCAGNPANLSQSQNNGWFDQIDPNPDGLRTYPTDPDQDLSMVPLNGDISGEQPAQRGAGKAICVRTCDGGYFPITPNASQDQLNGLDDLCRASCPNAEAKLYTIGQGGDLGSATAVDGTSYMALPAAFQFEKSFNASCTCKRPDQSWVQALAEAEKMLGGERKGDVTVTAKMSDELAKPKAVASAAGKAKGKKPQQSASVAAPPDQTVAVEGLRGSQAPTASNASAGIALSPAQSAAIVKEGDGPTKAVKGADGVMKTIRIIAP